MINTILIYTLGTLLNFFVVGGIVFDYTLDFKQMAHYGQRIQKTFEKGKIPSEGHERDSQERQIP